ncbi:hypothetical protein BH23GEM4_BH23GEM4_00980 [soil metagenome]
MEKLPLYAGTFLLVWLAIAAACWIFIRLEDRGNRFGL